MKPGDLVRYSSEPHSELRARGMVGLVLSEAYIPEESEWVETSPIVDVMWNMDRGLSYPAGDVTWDYVDEIELINETQ